MLFKCYELQKEPGYYSYADRALSVYTNSGHRPFFLNKSLQIALEEDFTKKLLSPPVIEIPPCKMN